MKNNYYSNYQGYLKNGNRVASFGIEKEGKLEIFLSIQLNNYMSII